MRRVRGWAVAWLLMVMPAGLLAQPGGGVMRPGDAIRLQVWMDEELSGQFVVDERGIVILPKLGPRTVGGEFADRVRDTIAAELADALPNPSIEVTILRRVLVRGEVRQPGTFLLAPYEATVADAISSAQGLTPDGRTDRVLLVRGETSREVRLDRGSRLAALPLESGDELVVPARAWMLRNPALASTIVSGVFSALITAIVLSVQ
jgi:protein involved in polysaccharide export with SLBB domain